MISGPVLPGYDYSVKQHNTVRGLLIFSFRVTGYKTARANKADFFFKVIFVLLRYLTTENLEEALVIYGN